MVNTVKIYESVIGITARSVALILCAEVLANGSAFAQGMSSNPNEQTFIEQLVPQLDSDDYILERDGEKDRQNKQEKTKKKKRQKPVSNQRK